MFNIGYHKHSFDGPHGIFRGIQYPRITKLSATWSGTEEAWVTTKGLRKSPKR